MSDNNQSEVSVTIVALVISVVALAVTANQLLAQLFSSADGYRRCAESVIGPWHVLRKRNRDCNQTRIKIYIIYRHYTWDLMPPDIIRPLAQVSASDIVVLAISMGMQWRSLDAGFCKIQADGNGYNITRMGQRVKVYSNEQSIHSNEQSTSSISRVDSQSRDTLATDFALVDNNRCVQDIADPRGVLTSIGCSENMRNNIKKHRNTEVRIDVITLMLPYLPVEGSVLTKYPSQRTLIWLKAIYKAHNIDKDIHGHWFAFKVYEIDCQYVNNLHHEKQGIKAYLDGHNVDLPKDVVEASWWVLQLRAIAWHSLPGL
ncbi:hypothetical protein P153DRAFT_395103 [Dothidotthia symphoricarpi CBS 119687]|uniref:Uncharacterized protein n=1 Tax=Dothidotthia symphoricarpi CBS 119687 TaxID=1392245 RepID=A0A6A6AMU2_9PLEO|nr:uncharacterized protein P153DRAFT_395103 [Dothidotthia symphoricarpi CBS 119687]KAF2131801.1 hypothetical protein P153DRAFT_395103 [Dothidotthia symphoricarpi CBS 119687]